MWLVENDSRLYNQRKKRKLFAKQICTTFGQSNTTHKKKNRDKFLPTLLLFTGLLLLAPVINFGIPSNITIKTCVCWPK